MKTNKLTLTITVFNLFLMLFLFYGTGSTDKGIYIGSNARIVETDTTLVVMYGDTNRIVIHRANHSVIFGSSSVNPTESVEADYFVGGSGTSTFDKVYVNSTVGVTEDFYIEGNGLTTGYFLADTLKTLNLKGISTGAAPIVGFGTLIDDGGGNAVLSISTTAITANSSIILAWREAPAGTLYADNITAGTSFNIKSTSGTDIGKKVSWAIFNSY